MASSTEDLGAMLPPAPEKRSHRLRWASLSVVVLGLAAGGIYAWRQVAPVISARKYRDVSYVVPKAPKLTPRTGETVFRIDPTHSSLTYAVPETFAGRKSSTATGVTNGLAGDLAVNEADLATSRVGTIVANVEQFHSDNNLRDARIRQDFLQSHRFPLAQFKLDRITGLSGKLVAGKSYPFTIDGFVTIKETTVRATFEGTAKVDGSTLTATATTKAKLSRFDAGPISIAGLVRTSDDISLTLAIRALDPTEHAVPTTITGPHANVVSSKDAPSYAKVVQPILAANCAQCHTAGQSGSAHVLINDAGDAKAISDGIKTVTQTRYMPPWPASDKGVKLAHKMTLSTKEIAQLAAWADGGAPLDVSATTKLTLTQPHPELVPRQDKTLRSPGYIGSLDNTNDYRCFLLDPKLTKPMYLTGYTFLADQVQELHHAQVFHVSASQAAKAPMKDGADGKPGWSCYGGPELRGRKPETVPGRKRDHDVGFAGQDDLVAGWVPGQAPVVFPEHSGILLEPGDALVLQLHYHYADKPAPDESGLTLQLDPSTADVKAMRVVNPLGPVELPCSPKDAKAPLCDRDAAMKENVKLYGPSGAGNENGLTYLCHKTPSQLAALFDGTVGHSSCSLKVPESGRIVGVMGHMHTLGSTIRLTLDKGTPKEQILLDIPRWSFDWQMNYQLEKPLHVTAGQPIELECSWDRSADPLRPPKYIVFAEGTEDEMCFATYTLIPDDQ